MFNNTLAYAGIGARKTPNHDLGLMYKIGEYLADSKWTLRSGGADGADTAFENGCDSNLGEKEIFLPWKGFHQHKSSLYEISQAALDLAAKFHPYWYNLKQGPRALMARNCYQVLGYNLNDPVQCVICWTPDGKITGGTGQAIRLANAYAIPVINMGGMNASEIEDQIIHLVDQKRAA